MVAMPNFFCGIASLLYPPSLTICSAPVDVGEYVCAEGEAKVSRIMPRFHAKCSKPFDGAITTPFACANCAHRPIYFDAAVSSDRTRGIVWHVILNFKLWPPTRTLFQSGRAAGRMAQLSSVAAVAPGAATNSLYGDSAAFDRFERMQNLRGAFHLRKTADVRNLRVLLIDDVLTTGSTLSECARVLKENGAHSVYAATAARA